MLIETALRFERRADVGVQGANSEVFFAFDPQLQATLVVKQIDKCMLDAGRYFEEASRLYAVRHPNVVEVLYSSSTNAYVYLAMPKYECSVEAVLRQRPLTVREIVRVGTGFLAGLHHVHVNKLVHFDVKPSNVLLDAGGNASLADFGMCQQVDAAGLATPEKVYESHIAPEYLTTSTSLSVAADIYQAGLTLYRMCTGTAIWQWQLGQFISKLGENWVSAVAEGQFPSRTLFPPHIPNRLRSVIERAIAVDPEDRYPNVLALMNELALVDERLDWQFTPIPGHWTWELDDGEYRRVVALKWNGALADILASRKNLASGKTTLLPKTGATGVASAKAARYVQNAIDALTPKT